MRHVTFASAMKVSLSDVTSSLFAAITFRLFTNRIPALFFLKTVTVYFLVTVFFLIYSQHQW